MNNEEDNQQLNTNDEIDEICVLLWGRAFGFFVMVFLIINILLVQFDKLDTYYLGDIQSMIFGIVSIILMILWVHVLMQKSDNDTERTECFRLSSNKWIFSKTNIIIYLSLTLYIFAVMTMNYSIENEHMLLLFVVFIVIQLIRDKSDN